MCCVTVGGSRCALERVEGLLVSVGLAGLREEEHRRGVGGLRGEGHVNAEEGPGCTGPSGGSELRAG
jgi:hypothetical protein